MKKMLLEGKTLIVDRYAFSGTAFSATKPVYLIFILLILPKLFTKF